MSQPDFEGPFCKLFDGKFCHAEDTRTCKMHMFKKLYREEIFVMNPKNQTIETCPKIL